MQAKEDIYLSILRKYWGYQNFRGIQRDIINSIGNNQDTLGLMPTGGGKSITFQVPAMAKEGVCIVITPLIALMKDQVSHLREKGIIAYAIYSGMTKQEILKVLENCIFGKVKFLYVSPERLSSELFQIKLKRINVSFITVDEAHCISQWGYDFRPSYLQISKIRQLKPFAPILALTATATPNVVIDIQKQLSFSTDNVFKMSFVRNNLSYVVRISYDKRSDLIHILNSVKGSGIIYARSRRKVKEIADFLQKNSISSTFYHAGLENKEKDIRQKCWQNDEIRIIVATNAFGMGIDKPNVRIVIHVDCPNSLEAYFQEAGRAGRDGKKSYAVLLYNNSDKQKLCKRITDTFPEKQYIRTIYNQLAYFYQIGINSGKYHSFPFDINKFCRTYKHFPIQVDSSLRILERAGYIQYETDPDALARIKFLLERHELNRLTMTNENERMVITTLLRNYGTLFNDFTYIDTNLISEQTHFSLQQLYLLLRGLHQQKILYYIPQTKTPVITYTKNRIEEKDIIITENIYENRKKEFIKRIETVIAYATNDVICRSKLLVFYFGEVNAKACQLCDICLKNNITSHERKKEAIYEVKQLLTDKKKHHITELKQIHLPQKEVEAALEFLITEEVISVDNCFIYLNQ